MTAALVLVNRSHLLLAAARYAEAVVAAREALRLAEMSSPTGRLSTALHNLGEALGFTGEYDEARWQLQRAVAHSRRLGPGRTASGLYGIAEIHRQLGHDEQAGAAYDEAIGLARRSGELQVLVPALAGLARLQVLRDQDAAAATAAEAEELATPALLPLALVAVGWAALGRGEREEAAGYARRAIEAASSVQAFDLLAEALELLGVASDDPADQRDALGKALSIWSDGGARAAAARVELLLGRLPGSDGVARSRARDAARLLQRLGVVGLDGRPVTEQHTPTPVRIQVLGGFEVRVGGEAGAPAGMAVATGAHAGEGPRLAPRPARDPGLPVRADLARRRSREDRTPPVRAARDGARCARPGQGVAARPLSSPVTPPASGSTSPTSRWTPTVCFATPPTAPT